MAQEDFDRVSDLAKKQVAVESNEEFLRGRVSALAGEKKQLVEENERLTEQNAELRQKNANLNSVKGDIAAFCAQRIMRSKLRSERDNLQRQLEKAWEFISVLRRRRIMRAMGFGRNCRRSCARTREDSGDKGNGGAEKEMVKFAIVPDIAQF